MIKAEQYATYSQIEKSHALYLCWFCYKRISEDEELFRIEKFGLLRDRVGYRIGHTLNFHKACFIHVAGTNYDVDT